MKGYRKSTDKLSKEKLNNVLKEYYNYQKENDVPKDRIVYMNKEDILTLNSLTDKISN